MDIQIIEKQLPIVTGNFEEVKTYLKEQLKIYETMVVTEETLQCSKASQRELASLRTNIDNYRKEIKKELTVPISQFEDKCKELIDMVATAEAPIKDGIEVFNNKIRQEKLDYANDIINAHSSNFGLSKNDFKILDSFTNLSGTKKSISDELDKQMQELVKIKEQKENNIELIKQQIDQLNTTFELEVKIEFADIEKRIADNNFMELSQYLLTEANRRKQTQDRIKEQLILKEKQAVEEANRVREQREALQKFAQDQEGNKIDGYLLRCQNRLCLFLRSCQYLLV